MRADATRRIKVARLRGRSEPLIRRGAMLLEDALRTASIPGIERDRLLLIRSLSLGLIHADKSAVVVARQLERQIAELARCAVHGTDPRAAGAQAVYFHDRLDAVIALSRQLGRGTFGSDAHAWYWAQAIPGWQPDLTPEQAGRFLLGVLLNLGYGVHFLAQAFQRLLEASCLDGILHAVREQDGLVLLKRCNWVTPVPVQAGGAVQSATAGFLPFPRTWQSVLKQWVIRWGPSDPRSIWLIGLALQSRRSDVMSSAELRLQAEPLLGAIADSADDLLPLTERSEDRMPYGNRESNSMVQMETLEVSAVEEDVVWSGRSSIYTVYAGFWFLVPLLTRVGFDRAIQDHPEWIDAAVPFRILSSLADRLAIPLDDPIRLWLSDEFANETDDKHSVPHVELMGEIETIVSGWRRSMRRWCRLHARLGLANVVRRTGRIVWDRTHVEVRMPLSCVDLRIRRAGLDLDPGWVPWLGKVLRFYYEAEGRLHGIGGIAGH